MVLVAILAATMYQPKKIRRRFFPAITVASESVKQIFPATKLF
jgi:hypothetical protein